MEDPLHDCLGFRLGSAYRRVDRLFNRAFAKVGLTHAHGYVLTCLLRAGELRVADLAQQTGFEQSTVSRLAKELARRKLIRRRKDPDDGRAQLLSAGTRGKAMGEDIDRLLQLANDRLVREMPDADREGLLRATELMDRLP